VTDSHLSLHPDVAAALAAGRPVVVQDTGFSDVLPVGEGILPFTTPDEAVAGIRAVESDYDRHAHAARAIAEEWFDSDKVLSRLGGWDADVMAPQQLAAQRRFLERAILRMLSPRIGQRTKRRTDNGHS